MKGLARYLDPVVEEHGLHLRYSGPIDLEVGVAPMLRILRAARPLGGHADHVACRCAVAGGLRHYCQYGSRIWRDDGLFLY